MNEAEALVDRMRASQGFLGVAATLALAGAGVVVLDPGSTLVSPGVSLAPGIVLWPGVVLLQRQGGRLCIGAGSVLHPGTRIVADGGCVMLGADVEIGAEGGFTIVADAPATITVGRGARLSGGGAMALDNTLGDGAQVIGPIRMQTCRLGAGGTHREPEPDLRGGVLKGMGVARGLDVPQGHVIQAFGLFAEAVMHRQSHFHPPSRASA